MQAADLLELRDDLSRESSRLQTLVTGLSELGKRLDHSAEAVEAAALRLHSFYTGACWNAWRWPPTPGQLY